MEKGIEYVLIACFCNPIEQKILDEELNFIIKYMGNEIIKSEGWYSVSTDE